MFHIFIILALIQQDKYNFRHNCIHSFNHISPKIKALPSQLSSRFSVFSPKAKSLPKVPKFNPGFHGLYMKHHKNKTALWKGPTLSLLARLLCFHPVGNHPSLN
uniref:Uncharacterized protein n=1 Tax=Micrurus paraensis TaxID=1970185 RepID=A0A2D4JT68_9SAUR